MLFTNRNYHLCFRNSNRLTVIIDTNSVKSLSMTFKKSKFELSCSFNQLLFVVLMLIIYKFKLVFNVACVIFFLKMNDNLHIFLKLLIVIIKQLDQLCLLHCLIFSNIGYPCLFSRSFRNH